MNNSTNYGFTLVEIMVAAAVASLVGTTALSVWRFANNHMSRTVVRQTLQADARRTLSLLKADLKAAKANSFPSQPSDNEISFKRYANQKDKQEKSQNKLVDISYKFAKPTLVRKEGTIEKVLSNNVESITISRKELTEVQQKNEKYLEARVDIALQLKSKVPGTSFEETFTEHTSAVIREEYYAKENEERKEIVSIQTGPAEANEGKEQGLSPEEAEQLNKDIMNQETDSAFFAAELTDKLLAALNPGQLNDLLASHKGTLKECQNQLNDLNSQISDVEGGRNFWQWLVGTNKLGAELNKLKKELKKVEDPKKGNDPLSSDKAASVSIKIEKEAMDTEKMLMKRAFKDKYVDPAQCEYAENDTPEERKAKDEKRKEAELMKTAYSKVVLDYMVKKAEKAAADANESKDENENENANEGESGPEAPDIKPPKVDKYKKQYDDYSQEMTREKIEEMMLNDLPKDTRDTSKNDPSFKAQVDSAFEERTKLHDYYTQSMSFYEVDREENENDYEAYEGLKNLKNLADSKTEMCRLMELEITNIDRIEGTLNDQKKSA